MLRDDLAFKMETSAVLVGLSGVAAVLAQFSGWMLPLLAMPVLAVRRSAVLAAARQTQAMRDALTGLGNRALFFSRADKLLARFERSGESVAVLMIDLDHFKDINDTLGHQVGDRVIQAVAGRIAHLGGDLGCVARLGGDEFAVALSGVDAAAAGAVAETLLADVVRPLQIGGTRMAIQASVGIAMAERNVDVTALMQRADIALYEAKQDRARWCLYDVLSTPTTPELGLLADLREALENGQLSVAFQPQVGLSDGRVTGAEALARWKHPERGYIPPSDFITLAENTGLISQVTDVVLEAALTALSDWTRLGLSCPVSVNLSARQLADLSLPERVSDALRRHGIPAGLLTVEVTESSILGDPRRAGADPARAAPGGRPDRRRRLRHRLLLAGLPAAAGPGRAEDRPQLRAVDVPGGPRRRAGPLDHRARAQPRALGGRRGRRGLDPGRPAPRAVLRRCPGLLPRPARWTAT